MESFLGVGLVHYAVHPTPEPDPEAPGDQPGLPPSAFGLRRIGPGGAKPLPVESRLSVRPGARGVLGRPLDGGAFALASGGASTCGIPGAGGERVAGVELRLLADRPG